MSAPEHDWLLPPADLAKRLPAWLVALPRWAPWAAVWNVKRGKFDKLPKNPRRAKYGLSTTTPEKWAALDLAQRGYAAHPGALHGVGFCMTGLQGVAAVDLDRCSAPDGTPTPWARDVLARALAEGGYCERSPSGTGFRIFMHDDEIADTDWNNHEVGIEVYAGTAPRFLTVTGHPWRPAT